MKTRIGWKSSVLELMPTFSQFALLPGADMQRKPRAGCWMWGCPLGIEDEGSPGIFRTWTQGWKMNF